MRLDKITFQRTEGGEPEHGLLVNEGIGPILDKEGKQVEECWHYRRTGDFTVEVYMGEGG